jgi:hypothetical protein
MDAQRAGRRSFAGALMCVVSLAAAACGTGIPTPAAATHSSSGSPVVPSAPSATSADVVPPCSLPMLTFGLAPWEGAMGTAYSGIVIGLTSGPGACSLHGALEVAVTGAAAPEIAADGRALPTDLVLRQEPLDPASPQLGEGVVRLAFRNWCPDQPADGTLQVQLVPLGVSPPLATTFPTPACASPGEPARLEVGPVTDGAS